MLTYDLSQTDGPLYEYLYDCIKADMACGKIKAGEKMPSKRNLARQLGISTITVENAYELLSSEGYIRSESRKGYFAENINSFSKIERNADGKIAVSDCNISVPNAAPKYKYDLSGNQPSSDSFPFSIWARLMREVISESGDSLLQMTPCCGAAALREAIAAHLLSFRSMVVDPNQIIVGAGTEYLYSLLIQLLGNDKKYYIENPGHKKIQLIYKSHGIMPGYLSLDEKGVIPAKLYNTDCDILHISPTHHFPTGITMPIHRRNEMLSWASEENSRYIIEDDYDSEFRLNGKPIPSLSSIDNNERVIYMNTFSKSLSSTIRISYMILPPHLAEEFYKKLSFYACTVSNFEQYTLAKFIKKGYFEKHLNRMRLYYIRQRKAILSAIEDSPLHKNVDIIENDSGLHFLIHFKNIENYKNFEEKLNKQDINLKSISSFYYDDCDNQGYYILNYSNIDMSLFAQALNIIATLI